MRHRFQTPIHLSPGYARFQQEVELALGFDITRLLIEQVRWRDEQQSQVSLPDDPPSDALWLINVPPLFQCSFGEPLPEGAPRQLAYPLLVLMLVEILRRNRNPWLKLAEAARQLYPALSAFAELEPELSEWAARCREHVRHFRQDLPGVRRNLAGVSLLEDLLEVRKEFVGLLDEATQLGQELAGGLFATAAPPWPSLSAPTRLGRKPKDALIEVEKVLSTWGFRDEEIAVLINDRGNQERAAERVGERRRKRSSGQE